MIHTPFLSAVSLLALACCSHAQTSRPVVHLERPPNAAHEAVATAPAVLEPKPVEPPRRAAQSPILPNTVVPGHLTTVAIPGHRAATVVHGQEGVTTAMIYLHGICGQVSRIRDWALATSEFVTTIAPMGNKPCPESTSRFSWNQDIELIHQLIDKALVAVAAARNGQLDTNAVAIFGYSQGASRAERLADRHPERYRWVILGGPPRAPTFEHFQASAGLALLVGTEEHQEALAEMALDYTARGVRTRFDQFLGVGHGFFGPSAPEVMRRTLTWLDLKHPGAALN